MTDELKAELERLRQATAVALLEAKGQVDGAINWADLQCIDAARCEGLDRDEWYVVWISEAAPESDSLKMFVTARLAAAGFQGVEVICEW
jgi:hypothetical protein